MKNKTLLKVGMAFSVLLLSTTLWLGLSSSRLNYFEISKQLDIFANLYKEVNVNYVDETHPEELMNNAINNMLKNLDPYTVHIPANEIENYRMMQTGQYGGIGASIMRYGDYPVVTSPKKGYPADKAGLKAGDLIKSVAGKDMKDKSPDDISNLLKGSPGTTIELTYERLGEEITVTLTREDIQLKSVPYYGMLDDKTGYIVLTSFTDKASKEIGNALSKLKAENDLQGLVLDLRSNPGGLLSESINVSNLFLEKGEKVVETRGRTPETSHSYRTLKAPMDASLPLVVLINGRSASASEIVAGTMQDLDRGVVMGQRSYGKGLVRQTKPLSYGSQVKITIAKYYTPSGRCVQAINYAERDAKGDVKRLPDSLRTAFTTAGGRTVYDGAGVDPDVSLTLEEYPHILMSLIRNRHIFDYVSIYEKEHVEIAPAKDFKMTVRDYNEFTKYLSDKEYHYETETERFYDRLEKVADAEEFKEIDKELASLKNAIEKAKNDDLEKFKTVIMDFLEAEITERYYYEEGRIEQQIFSDLEVAEAKALLANPSKYQNILTVVQ